jgi:2',3'-cyclic-nucleotide 2'-phosphodiesterase (5'-nucleotidase family)
MCILLPILIGVLLASCGTHTLAVSPLELVVSGDTDGWITPCGCTANQSGGLLRRGTYLRQQREHATVLYADVGGAPAGVSAYQQTLFESILKGEQQMNICAHNIGGPEAAFGSAYLRHLQSLMRVPLISANLRDADGAEVAPPLVIVAAGGRRIAFVGIVSPRYAQPGIRILEPLATVRALVAERKSEFDTLIILAYLPDEDLQRFAADLPEADAVIGGPTGQSIPPKVIGPTLLASATRKGHSAQGRWPMEGRHCRIGVCLCG